MQVGISDQERDALVAFLREHIDKDRFTRSSRFRPLKSFLSKLEPYRGTRSFPANRSRATRGLR